MKLSTVAILLGAAVAAVPGVVSAESLRANYLQEIDFFANPNEHDCYRVGGNSCSRLPQCALKQDDNSCLELVNSCSDTGRTICQNGAVQMSSSSRTNQNLALCEWDRREGCIVARDRRGNRSTVRVTLSSDAKPRPRSYIRLSESEDYLDYEEDVTDSSEDYDYNDYDYEDEEEEGEDSEDMFSTSEDYADIY